jgi:glutathione S-transferase
MAQYNSEKWLDWQLASMWPPLRVAFLGITRTPEAEQNYEVIRKRYQDANQLFGLLDTTLANQEYCSGNQFHIGDIALALCVHRWILLNAAFPEKTGPRAQLKNIESWLKRLEQETHFNDIAEKELNIVK